MFMKFFREECWTGLPFLSPEQAVSVCEAQVNQGINGRGGWKCRLEENSKAWKAFNE